MEAVLVQFESVCHDPLWMGLQYTDISRWLALLTYIPTILLYIPDECLPLESPGRDDIFNTFEIYNFVDHIIYLLKLCEMLVKNIKINESAFRFKIVAKC
jgi:hypothetical protein